MRIQHNISALNAHRQLGNNNSSVSRNLEKLSSGYRINKAGDDAAGLAISEKMRAQIKGLDTAQKNAQDGISLVQTAEGALTEVHSMLNRMTELATQSANGTYQNETDRDNLQKEITSLKDEINRISDGTNYNGIKLLNGDQGGNVAVTSTEGSAAVGGAPAVKASFTVDLSTINVVNAKAFDVGDVSFTNASGGTLTGAGLAADADFIAAFDGADITVDNVVYVGSVDAAGKLTLTEKADPTADGAQTAAAIAAEIKNNNVAAADTVVTDLVVGKAAVAPNVAAKSATTSLQIKENPKAGNTVKVGNTTYEFVANANDATKTAGATAVVLGNTTAATAQALKDALDNQGGNGAGQANAAIQNVAVNGDTITFEAADVNGVAVTDPVAVEQTGGGLKLQIGEDANSYNQVSVVIGDMDTANLGIAGVDISTQEGAEAALDLIKTAIDKVSSTRGDLGALQNRLDHTINNLGVASENMSAAESRIRDVDMAKEMMDFTKNNILTQASQAMLAQANQLPQGVLQLLQ